jgi:18S rRNA (adenine1779-N6/adenine1780-N6)-dimethyltransferase
VQDRLHDVFVAAAAATRIASLQALEQNYITFKALSLGAGQQQQQPAPASIAALGSSSEPAGMDVSDDDDEDDAAAAGASSMAVDGMDTDNAAAAAAAAAPGGRKGKGKVSAEFKEIVMSVLTAGGFDQMRPAKMTQEDFLKLLADFNAAGIHFS